MPTTETVVTSPTRSKPYGPERERYLLTDHYATGGKDIRFDQNVFKGHLIPNMLKIDDGCRRINIGI